MTLTRGGVLVGALASGACSQAAGKGTHTMTKLRKPYRPHTNPGWLDRPAFSLGGHRSMGFAGFREPRAITNDSGFSTLPHRDMEKRIELVRKNAPAEALVFEVPRGDPIPCA